MSIIDKYLAVHANAVQLRGNRAQLIAGNLANAETPGYRPRDLDFRAAMEQAATASSGTRLRTTHPGHRSLGPDLAEQHTNFRDVAEGSLDANTVDTEFERAQFTDNAVRYQASVQFLNSRISSVLRALRGE